MADPLWLALISAVVGGAMSIAIAVANNRLQKNRTDAEISKDQGDAAQSFTDAALKLIAPLKEQVQELRAEVVKLRTLNEELRLELIFERREKAWLKVVLRKAGIQIPPTPIDFSEV